MVPCAGEGLAIEVIAEEQACQRLEHRHAQLTSIARPLSLIKRGADQSKGIEPHRSVRDISWHVARAAIAQPSNQIGKPGNGLNKIVERALLGIRAALTETEEVPRR